jgi:hypothetical protein
LKLKLQLNVNLNPALTLPPKWQRQRTRNETCLSEASSFHFPLALSLWRKPEGQRHRGRLFLLTFFGEAKKVSGSRATPGDLSWCKTKSKQKA